LSNVNANNNIPKHPCALVVRHNKSTHNRPHTNHASHHTKPALPVQLLGAVLDLNIVGRESSSASTTARLSPRFTRMSSGSGMSTSVMSETTIMCGEVSLGLRL
jgi:hypothetical protein